MQKLTSRQTEILEFLETHMQEYGAPPTRVEIAERMGFRSPNAAEDHLRALYKKGAIELVPGTSRGIRLLSNKGKKNQGIPLVGKVAAGAPILAQENIDSYHQINTSIFSSKPDYLLEVTGDSMIKAGIFDGDYIAVKAANDVKAGDIVVARVDEEVTVKRFSKNGNIVVLAPENDAYQDIVIKVSEFDFAIEGKVIGIIRNI